MDMKMNPNAINQFSKGTIIYTEGEPVFYVAMIIKGRVLVQNEGARVIMGSGAFLGINDLFLGKFQSTYTALDDLIIYVYPISRMEELENVLNTNKDYHGFMVASLYKLIYDLEQVYQGVLKNGMELYQFLKETYSQYIHLSEKRGIRAKVSDRINALIPLDSDLELLLDRINYYIECKSLPLEAVKLFYSYGNAITLYQVEDQVNVVNQQMDSLKVLARDYIAIAGCLVDDSDTSLFQMFAEMAVSMESSYGNGNELLDIMDSIIEEINKAELFTERLLGKRLKVNRKMMEEVYHLLLTGNKGTDVSAETFLKYSKDDSQRALTEMNESFSKILEYAGIQGVQAEEMKAAMLDYVFLKDRNSTDDKVRAVRKILTENHYTIYQRVFLRAYKEKIVPRIVDLFLKYGYADERLLTKEQLLTLYFLSEEEQKDSLCKVYDIKTWLTLIYEGKKEPSKNEFDLDYPETLAGLKKQGKLSEKDILIWMSDPMKKLEYEIQNMFRYNNRTTNGQITSFVPVLHQESFSGGIDKILVKARKVNEAVAGILRIDYSIFDREVMYVNKEKNIAKEYIMKKAYPDIILMPNAGNNGVMWQDISGKRRDSSGRFLMPIFTDANLNTMLIRIFGRFRWELCRTIEGASWNDITHKSLTSEYSDYLQFYRKNKELSEDKKEKIKSQIQKGRNSSREIFVMDYEQWINYEAIGALKLNKPVRELMATYCPFAKEIREKLKALPMFEEAMARYNKNKQKKVREIESRYRLLMKENIEITSELKDTLVYYMNS